jgi:phosphate transport system permease protein
MFGDQSIIAGDSNGKLNAWFRVERPDAGTQDGYQLVAAHVLEPHAAPVAALAMSSRDKSFLSADTAGNVWLRHMTSQQTLGKLSVGASLVGAASPPRQSQPAADNRVGDAAPMTHSENPKPKTQNPSASSALFLQITPKADGIFALDASGRAHLWQIDNPHPETTLGTIFGKVWYEGYNHPEYTWQSSSGNDDFEPKFSLVPLIFGTLKATFYALLFAVPIALLGAIYTSQFLDKRLRAPIKSTVETMASLPSVVLGFIAALVLAPFVENWIVAALLVFAVIPMLVIVFGYFWQMMPTRVIVRYSGLPQFLALCALVFLGVWLARELSGPVEGALFSGDFKAWLDKRVGTGTPGIAILAFPFALFAVWFAQYKLISQRLSFRFSHLPRAQLGLIELSKLVGILLASAIVAWIVGVTLSSMGFDPRDSLMGTYVQRNTFIVGFVMGFAVIPIIYTISEDALSSVPEHLKSASLGCGATPWQTAIRVILPVGMSGIFSAVMIGLGRAVGETMIVVMAAGNTPIMDINIFNGLRALSANIAVELPEAVKDSTLFRMLFLAALTLFVITFIINTVAEIIRMRFRKRAFQL